MLTTCNGDKNKVKELTGHFAAAVKNNDVATIYDMYPDAKRLDHLKLPKSIDYFSTVYVPAEYSFAVVSPGRVTEAVAPCGMVNFHIHLLPSYFHSLFMRPATD